MACIFPVPIASAIREDLRVTQLCGTDQPSFDEYHSTRQMTTPLTQGDSAHPTSNNSGNN